MCEPVISPSTHIHHTVQHTFLSLRTTKYFLVSRVLQGLVVFFPLRGVFNSVIKKAICLTCVFGPEQTSMNLRQEQRDTNGRVLR